MIEIVATGAYSSEKAAMLAHSVPKLYLLRFPAKTSSSLRIWIEVRIIDQYHVFETDSAPPAMDLIGLGYQCLAQVQTLPLCPVGRQQFG